MLQLMFAIHASGKSVFGAIGSWASAVDPTRRGGSRFGERGASLVEYSLLVAMIAVVCIGAVTFFGGQTADVYSGAGSSFN